MCGANSRTVGRHDNLLYQILINVYLYDLGPDKYLNFVPRDREKPENGLFVIDMIFCHVKSSATIF